MARCFRPGRVPCKVRHEGLGQAEGAAPPTPVPESRFPSCLKARCELVAGVCRQSFFRGEQKNESAQVAGALRWIGELRDGALIRVVGATVGPLPRLSASGGGRRRCQGSGGGTGLLGLRGWKQPAEMLCEHQAPPSCMRQGEEQEGSSPSWPWSGHWAVGHPSLLVLDKWRRTFTVLYYSCSFYSATRCFGSFVLCTSVRL